MQKKFEFWAECEKKKFFFEQQESNPLRIKDIIKMCCNKYEKKEIVEMEIFIAKVTKKKKSKQIWSKFEVNLSKFD